MLEDKHRARKWSVIPKSGPLIGQWSRTCPLKIWAKGFSWTFLREKQSLWLFIWMRIYIVKGHYKDYPQSQYFLGSWHYAWWLEDSLCHKRNAPFWNTLRFIPSFFFFFAKRKSRVRKPSINFCSRYPVFQIRLLIEEGKY